jgi:hypothetical protein
MTRSKLYTLVGLLAIVAACGIAPAAEKTLYRKASPYTTIVVTEDEEGLRTLQ